VWRPACGQQKRQGYRRFVDDGNRDQSAHSIQDTLPSQHRSIQFDLLPKPRFQPGCVWHGGQHPNRPRNSWTLRRTTNLRILRKFTVTPQAQARGRYVWRTRPFVGKGWDRSTQSLCRYWSWRGDCGVCGLSAHEQSTVMPAHWDPGRASSEHQRMTRLGRMRRISHFHGGAFMVRVTSPLNPVFVLTMYLLSSVVDRLPARSRDWRIYYQPQS
jgi:hypothetical protein